MMCARASSRDDARPELDRGSDRGVEPLADEIDLPVVEVPVGRDRGVTREERAEHRQDVVAPERR